MMDRRIAIVTGANRGLGLETSRALAHKGYQVVVTARELEKAEVAARSLEPPGLPAELDVGAPDSVARFQEEAHRRWPRIEALVNNAGISLDGFDAEVARRTIEVNFRGAVRVTEALIGSVVPGGRVVMVSSGLGSLGAVSSELAARFVDPGLGLQALFALVDGFLRAVAEDRHAELGWPSSAYAVSKVAMNAFVRILAKEHPGLRVNAVSPGWVRTAMGGRNAPRSVKDGADGIVFAADAASVSGRFLEDGREIAW
jgi:NAD(P)-dependent dehydrogenase (short-subunit alcohol dehydrogenase family)